MENIPYKQYTRTPRSQAVTNNFSGGMCYTNQPIQEGYCRLLVNYDVTDSGRSISSRPGLFVTKHQIVKEYTIDSSEFEAFDLTASKFITEAQVRNIDWHYEPVYIFLKDAMVINDREGLGTICTIMQDLSGAQVLNEQTRTRCFNPAPKTVFDFPFQNSRELLQPLYCTAWHDSFYTFLEDATDQRTKLVYLEKNKTTIVEPKIPTETEIVDWGYNALATDLYNTVAPKKPIVLYTTINTDGWSQIDLGATDAYQIGIVDANTLGAVDPTALEIEKVYYVVMNYNLPYFMISEHYWDTDRHRDQQRDSVFQLCDYKNGAFYPIVMTDYADILELPTAKAMQELNAYSGATTGNQTNGYYNSAQKYNYDTNSYQFRTGGGKFNSDNTGFHGYMEGTGNALAPKLLYFPFMLSDYLPHTLAVRLTETGKVSAISNYTKVTFKEIQVQAVEQNQEDWSDRKSYTLALGKTLTFWKNRLWIGNVPEDPTMLFYSQTDMPEYFPYPSNTHIFTEPIIKLITETKGEH